jgi:hypothetical protein
MHGGRFRARIRYLTASAALLAATGCNVITGQGDVGNALLDSLKTGTVPAAYAQFVIAAGQVCPGVTAPLIAAQIEQESGWNPRAVSPKGAQGLSQFMPGTWAEVGRDANGNGVTSPFDPADAIDAQARYDCSQLAVIDGYLKSGRVAGDRIDLMLASYNAGMGRVLDAGGNIAQLPDETQKYIAQIHKLMRKYADVSSPVGGDVGTGNAAIVRAAARWMGTPYVWGGGELEKPSGIGRDGRGPGWDCSSLTRHAIWIASGRTVEIPRVSSDQARAGKPVPPSLAAMAPGDIIAFSIHGGGIDHVGIYAGNGTMIHAPRTGKNVEQVDLTDAYWSKLPWTVRRFL